MSSQPPASLASRLATIGAVVGAAIPLGLAAISFTIIYLQPKPPPGTAACGMASLGACALVTIAPVASLVMAAIGWLYGKVYSMDPGEIVSETDCSDGAVDQQNGR